MLTIGRWYPFGAERCRIGGTACGQRDSVSPQAYQNPRNPFPNAARTLPPTSMEIEAAGLMFGAPYRRTVRTGTRAGTRPAVATGC
jgi:hypothetical protein